MTNSSDASGPTQATTFTSGSDYLDSASSSALHPAAREALIAALDQGYADPRRLHGPGRTARLLLDNARAVIAEALGVRSDEVSFTSSGTEAIHRGLLGLHQGRRRQGTYLAHSAIEHSAVFESARWAEASTVSLGVGRTGVVDSEEIAAAVADPQSPLSVAAIQLANAEVGTIQPIAEFAELLGGTPLFMDASAATGHVAWPEGWAAAAASAHKWGGPAGIGLLVVRKGGRWRNPFPADDRIDPRVCGFENVPGALGAAAALQAVTSQREALSVRHTSLATQLRSQLAAIPDLEMVSPAENCLPHVVAFSCLYVDGDALVTELDRKGYGVASGSACTSSTLSPSHVLAAMGVLTHGNVRVSFGSETTALQLSRFADAVSDVVSEIRQRVGLPS